MQLKVTDYTQVVENFPSVELVF